MQTSDTTERKKTTRGPLAYLTKGFFKSIFSPLILLFVMGVTGVAASYFYFEPRLPKVETLRTAQLQLPIQVYGRKNELIAEFGQFRRRPVKIDDLPEDLLNAFIAIEDARFWTHTGVDFRGVARASVKALRTRSISEGASTITMQLARNMFLTNERTATRKLREVYLALNIEREFSKKEILELYLNKIFLGKRAYGVGSAAEIYYGKKVKDLSLAQMAMIAGLPKAPSRYNPISRPKRAKQRRDYILQRMLEQSYISRDQYNQAVNEGITAKVHQVEAETYAPYMAEMARAEAEKRFGVENMYTHGLKIYTTLDNRQQSIALKTIRKHLIDYSKRHGYRGALEKISLDEFSDTAKRRKKLKSYNNYQGLETAIVLASNAEEAVLQRRHSTVPINLKLNQVKWARKYINENKRGKKVKRINDVLAMGDVVWVSKNKKGVWELSQLPKVTGAITVVNPRDGAIEAIVGGFDFTYSKFNRATQALRQPGSSFKPFVYSAALSTGEFSPASWIEDEKIVIPGSTWSPKNFDKKYHGPTLMRQALKKSRNIYSIKLLQAIGVDTAIDYAKRFGFEDRALPRDLTLSLGTGSVTPLDIATAYATFANGGFKVDNYYIRKIVDRNNKILFRHKPATVCRQCPRPKLTELSAKNMPKSINGNPVAERIMKPYVHHQITSMLRDVAKSGTAAKASRVLERDDLAGKTGTTNDQRDAWFSGFTPKKVATVWVGFDQLNPLGKGETSTRAALPIWIDFMKEAIGYTKAAKWPSPPRGMKKAVLDARNGLYPGDLTVATVNELVIESQLPTEEDLLAYQAVHPEEFIFAEQSDEEKRQVDRVSREYQQQVTNYNRRVKARQKELARLKSIGSSYVPPALAPPPARPEVLVKMEQQERMIVNQRRIQAGLEPITDAAAQEGAATPVVAGQQPQVGQTVTPTTQQQATANNGRPLTVEEMNDQQLMDMIRSLNLDLDGN